jgi:hypothetical protein
MATGTGIGAGASNALAGFIVKAAGSDAGFIALVLIAAAGGMFHLTLMPETRPASVLTRADQPTDGHGDSLRVGAVGVLQLG